MNDSQLANSLIDNAWQALKTEMTAFAFQESYDLLKSFKPEGSVGGKDWNDIIKVLPDYISGAHKASDVWQENARNIQVAQQAVQKETSPDSPEAIRAKEDERLLSTVDCLIQASEKKRQEINSKFSGLEALAQQADLMREFSETWTIYQVAWQQHHPALNPWEPNATEGPSLESIRAGDKVVRGLYQVAQNQGLDLEMPHQLLMVVPFGAGLYAVGSDLPTPYVLSPYWGHRQVWTWLGYAHEVGHHIYRNIKGLSDELKVNVAMELWRQGLSHDVQCVWFGWLEEIFADLFGLSQVGPAFARTQQLMLLYLPQPVTRREVSHPLLAATDEAHPVPYLRGLLAISAMRKLQVPEENITPLEENWGALIPGEVDKSKVYPLVRGRLEEMPTEDMEKAANFVLDVMLNTDLDALAPQTSPRDRRNLATVFSASLDPTKLDLARKAITEGEPSTDLDVRHLLAAMQEGLEGLTQIHGEPPRAVASAVAKSIQPPIEENLPEAVDGLNTRFIKAVAQAYQELPLPLLASQSK